MTTARSSITTEYLTYDVTAVIAGTEIDPTADDVEFAFVAPGALPEAGEWEAGEWETVGAGYSARILVGPDGTVTLSAGTYAVWLKVTDSPEVPANIVGSLTIDGATLATPADVADRLGRPPTEAEATRVPSLLADVSATVRHVAGQQFTLSTSTVRVRPRGGVVRLPQRPVVDVTAVETVTSSAVAFSWDGLGQDVDVTGAGYPVANLSLRRRREPPLDVTYEHGYEVVPDDIVGLVCQVVMRCLGAESTDGAVDSETIASYSYRLRDSAAAGAKGLLPAERAIALAYRLPALPIRMLG